MDLTRLVKLSASSTVQGFKKENMLNDDPETCWQSKQGLKQVLILKFEKEEQISRIGINFQGGFASKSVEISNLNEMYTFEPKDKNNIQYFDVPFKTASLEFKLDFTASSDFYGRIIIYKLEIYG